MRTFPIIKTRNLDVDTGSKLHSCPICWLKCRDTHTLRRLPCCNHVFHRRCVDPLLEKQTTCPVCGVTLMDSPKASENLNASSPRDHRVDILVETLHCRSPSLPKSPTSVTGTPSWVLTNPPVPLPRTATMQSSSPSERFEIDLNSSDGFSAAGESPLLKYNNGGHVEDWDDADLDENAIDISFTFGTEIPVEKRQLSSSSSADDKGVDSFSFNTNNFSSTEAGDRLETSTDAAVAPAAFQSTLRRSRGKELSSSSSYFTPPRARYSRSNSRSSLSTTSSLDYTFKQFVIRPDSEHPHLQAMSEYDARNHLPLTRPPDQSSFEVLPVVTGSGSSDFRLPRGSRNMPRVAPNRCN